MSGNFNHNKKVISIETYITNPNQNVRINSPYSVQAIKMLGYSQKDIEYIPIKKYQELDDRYCTLPKDLKKRRYEMYNNYRLSKIQEIYECRNQLKEEGLLESEHRCKTSYNNRIHNNIFIDDNIEENDNTTQSSAIKEELKKFNRIKRKNEQDLINNVEFELKRQIMLKESEAKMRKRDFKIEIFNKENEIKQLLEIQQKEKRERIKRERDQQKEEEIKQKNKEQYLKEQERFKNEAEKEAQRAKENKLKQKEKEHKIQLFHEKVNQMNEVKHQQLLNKMNELNEQEIKRQQLLEEKRAKQIELNNEKSRKKQELIQKNKENLENTLRSIQMEYQLKQQKNAIKKKRLDEERDLELKQRAEEANKRAEKTKEVLIRDKEIQQQKIDDFNRKQNLIIIKKKELEVENQKEQELRIQRNIERENHCKLILNTNEQLVLKRKQEILNNMKQKEETTLRLLNDKFLDHLQKIEENKEKMLLKQNYINELAKKKEDKRGQDSRILNAKRIKIEQMQEQKKALSERNRIVKEELSVKRQMYEVEFKNLFHYKKLDDKQLKKIHEMFPDNEKINGLLIRFADLEQETKKEMDYQNKISNNNVSLEKNKNQNEKVQITQTTTTEKEILPFQTYNDIVLKKNITSNNIDINKDNKTNRVNGKEKNNSKEQNNNYKLEDEVVDYQNREYHKAEQIAEPTKPKKKVKSVNKDDKEIKIKQYHINLMGEYIDLLRLERAKEEYRLDKYIKAKRGEKKKMARQMTEARKESIAVILKKQEENSKKLKKFEQLL